MSWRIEFCEDETESPKRKLVHKTEAIEENIQNPINKSLTFIYILYCKQILIAYIVNMTRIYVVQSLS